jgi:ectoine hydroxylase-related dioxygenase (phytanoyl-CoA dioxygenase family)
MNDEQKYLFDLHGYIVLPNVVPSDVVAACNAAMDRFETMEVSDYPEPLSLGTPRTEQELYISNILEGDTAFAPLIDLPPVLDIVETISGSTYRLNHTYAIWRWGGGYTGLHMNGTPIIDKCQYRCQNGQIISTLTKAVFPMLDAGPEDGCFAVIPGSHKSNFNRPWGNHPDENPPLVPVPAKAGDCIVFTEALTHGSMVNTSGRPRRTLYYCYSIGWMPDWGGQHLRYSLRATEPLTEAQREILRLKMN